MAIRVLIADDSLVMRLMIKDVLRKDPEIEVVAAVKNGKEALVKTSELRPDVVVLDMLMGEYDGPYAVGGIMKECPTPIIVLSALGNTDLKPIQEVLDNGAFDYLNKPQQNNTRIKDVGSELISKIKAAASTSPDHLKQLVEVKEEVNHYPHTFDAQSRYELVVIGASTGGPTAVQTVISKLPQNLNIPVVIVQHMPDNFIDAFAARLNDFTPMPVVSAKNGMLLESGKIYITRANQNTRLVSTEQGRIRLERDKVTYMEYNNPSINGMMISASKIYGKKVIGVVLTGMGKDGTAGIKAIKGNKGLTIAQNEATSVVYGMPREAAASGCVDQVMPLKDVAGYIVSSLD